MSLKRLIIDDLRNLSHVDIELTPGFNLFIGENGSGKTSILESIHLLGLARSFRTRMIRRVIQYEKNYLRVFGELKQHRLGIQKNVHGQTQIRIDGESTSSAAQLAQQLPLLLINPDSYQLFTTARTRRQFLDWGVFHVEQDFHENWARMQKVLKQRNLLIKQGARRDALNVWDRQYIRIAETLNSLRKRYLVEFEVFFKALLPTLLDLDVQLQYRRGWNADLSLEDMLDENYERELKLGYTLSGPHRADLRLVHRGIPVESVLSRGQQKLLVFALKLAQGRLLRQLKGQQSIYLIDDLAAELDAERRQRVFSLLSQLNAQVFVTGVDVDAFKQPRERADFKLFHMEHLNPVIDK